ncbi:maternal effect embryo arrest 47 [Hibiscus trionum]|uniref:Maternal effect embryo arrest 47 n=1 Tax=Hibiscus trionum TaxID=183268 RepID=A0A9W7IU08_HIBTR|nr:maternal effect embryo arrest 47 [Hibiscus trionum]
MSLKLASDEPPAFFRQTPMLPMFSSPQAHMQSPERSGTLTPPLHALASVPFLWEEEPGKPKPCCTLTIFNNPNELARKCMQLPPRLLHDAKNTKVLESPRFQSSSSSRMGSESYGSFRGGGRSPERVQLGTMVLSKRGTHIEKGLLGCCRKKGFKGRREVGGTGNSCVFPSSGDRDGECSAEEESNGTSVKITRIKRVGSFHSKPKFWASIYQGLKLAVPWSKRETEDGFMG